MPQQVQTIEDFLRPPHREGGDDHLVVIAVAVGDGFRQFVERGLFVLVIPVAVGAFNEEVIRLLRGDRIVHEESSGAAQIARENQLCGFALFRDRHFQKGRTENMARIAIGHTDARVRFQGLAVFHEMKLGGDVPGVFHRVQGFDVLIFGVLSRMPLLLLVFPLRFHFLNVRAVFEHQPGKGGGRWSAVDGAFEAFMDEARQKARVIDMGMREQNKGNIGRRIGFGIEIAGFDLRVALMHPAIDGKTDAAGFNQVAGPCNGLRRPEKMDFHRTSSYLLALPAGRAILAASPPQ